MGESARETGANAAWNVYHETFSNNIHQGSITNAYHTLKSEFDNIACNSTSHTEPLANYWQALQSRLTELDPKALPKLSVAYGSEMNARFSANQITVDASLAAEAPCVKASAEFIEKSMKTNLMAQYNELKDPVSGIASLFASKNADTGLISKVKLDKTLDNLNRTVHFIPVE